MPTTEIALNQEELNQYSHTFAQRLSDYYFIDHKYIEGSAILNFCDIKQVNLLLVKNLFEKWQVETKKLRSPYFNYEHPAVKKAMQEFMNTISQHIKISQEHFLPLLIDSTRETLLLIVQPGTFFKNEINKPVYDPPQASKFKDSSKYFYINKKIWREFVDRLGSYQELSHFQVQGILNTVLEEMQRDVEPMQWNLQSFSDIYHLDIPRLLGQEEENNQYEVQTVLMQEEPTIIQEKPQQVSSKVIHEDTDENHTGNSSTLNDAYKDQQGQKSLADRFRDAKVMNLRAAITLNQKFQFINELFEGDSFAFNEALDKIEGTKTYEEASQYINDKLAIKYSWDSTATEVRNFIDIVERKFF